MAFPLFLPRMLRRLTWRLGRKLYAAARGDGANDPLCNGEYWLLEQAFALSKGPVIMVDVGANLGGWSARALDLSRGREIRIHAVEPCSGTRQALQQRFAGASAVQVEGCAFSDREGETEFYSSAPGVGTNSLSPVSGSVVEYVAVTTMDRYMNRLGLDRATLVKVDAEGFDLLVIRGASSTLAEGRIDLLQFEYNWRWMLNRCSLRDVFETVKGLPYRFGKLVGESIEFYAEWHPELDRFFENNYVLVRRGTPWETLGRPARFDASNTPVWE